MGVKMTDTNLTQRNNADWLDSTADLVRQARRIADEAEWAGHPSADRKRREADAIEARYGAGETLTPRF